MNPGTLVVVVLLLVLLLGGVAPVWPHSTAWGPWPGGIVWLLIVVLLVVALFGRS